MQKNEIRDPIHGLIERSELSVKLMNTYPLQRLRGIKQLAMANLVYPGALHTRFDHSIGVMHIANQLANHFNLNDDDKLLVGIAALLHDVGHGPFSHVSESILERYIDPNVLSNNITEKIHEEITCRIILHNNEIDRYLSKDYRENIVNLLLGNTTNFLLKGIVSGPLDADKQDYLLRDSYFCGVKYGVYDIERLINSLTIIKNQFNQIIGVKEEGVYNLEQFVIAKYHMSAQVYRHKVRLLTDAMITRAIILGIEVDKINWLAKLYKFEDNEEYIKNYLDWDDTRLTNNIIYGENKDGYAKKIFLKIKNRVLFKRIFYQDLVSFKAIPRLKLSKLSENINLQERIEETVCQFLTEKGFDYLSKYEVIIKVYSIKSVRASARDNESSILVLTEDSKNSTFEEMSTLFKSINENESKEFVEIYAPIFFGEKKKELLSTWRSQLTILIEETIESFEKR